MVKQITKSLCLLFFIVTLTACNGMFDFFDKDNTPSPTPLTNFQTQIKPKLLWATNISGGAGNELLRMDPAVNNFAVFTASKDGTITANDLHSGRIIWQSKLLTPISTGPGIGDGIVVVASPKGDIITLDQISGRPLWRHNVNGEVIANPAVGEGAVIIKTVDGNIFALAVTNGNVLWTYPQAEPNLILHQASAPIISDQSVFIGFAKGDLTKFRVRSGQLEWQQTITIPQGAFAIQRMVDIDANPIVFDHQIYVATYQGKITSLGWGNGKILWEHDISSYTGMAADTNSVFVTDTRSFIWSFGADNGLVNWRNTKLADRIITAPVLQRKYIVVADAEGYLHWLAKDDGRFVARSKVGAPVYATPVVKNNVLYVLTNNGTLLAYTLNR